MPPKAYDAEKMSPRDRPHSHPSLTASRARIQASEEPLGERCWTSGSGALWDSGRRMEGMGVRGQSRRAEDATTPSPAVSRQQAWLEVPESRFQMGVEGQTPAGHEGLMPKQTFSSHHLLLYK